MAFDLHEREYEAYQRRCYKRKIEPKSYYEWLSFASLNEVMGLDDAINNPKYILTITGLTLEKAVEIAENGNALKWGSEGDNVVAYSTSDAAAHIVISPEIG